MTENLRGVIQALNDGQRVLVCSHIEPDGDSIGSQLAMAELLEALGKEAVIVNQDPVPVRYAFLDPGGKIRRRLPDNFQPDTVIILDCSNRDRLGTVKELISEHMVVITIDHHRATPQPGDPAYLDIEASSTGELIVDLAHEMNISIGSHQANCLYTAILSDTGGFRFPNTTAKSLAAAAEQVERGAKPHAIAAKIYEQRSVASLRLLIHALSKLTALEEKKVSLVCIAPEDLRACGAIQEETEGIVDFLVTLKDTLVGVLIRQTSSGVIKVNLRTRGNVKANRIAEAMGGGGHPNAAGYRTRLPLDQAKDELLREIRRWL